MATIDNRLPTEGTQKDILTAVEAISNNFDVTASTIPFDSNTTIKGAVDYKQDLYIPRLEQDANNDSLGNSRFNVVEHIAGANYNLPTTSYYNIVTIAGADPDFATQIAYHETDHATYIRTKNSGTWSDWVAQVWGVKGNNESTYRGGNVNLTAYNVQALYAGAGAQVGSLNDLVNLLNSSGNNRSYCGTVKFTANIGIGIATNSWQRVFAMSQNAPNNGTYSVQMYCLFFPEDTATNIKWALITGTSTNNYSVAGYGEIIPTDKYVESKRVTVSSTTYLYPMSTTHFSTTASQVTANEGGMKLGLGIDYCTMFLLDSNGNEVATFDSSVLKFKYGGLNGGVNQRLVLWASSEPDYYVYLAARESAWSFAPAVTKKLRLGSASYLWTTVYAQTGSINTSDRNEKKDIIPLDENAVEFIMALNPVSYKFIDGESGRTHYGMIAQDVEEEMAELGMTPLDFAGFCKDQKVTKFVDSNGEEKDMPVEGEYSYGLRYEEFIAPMIKTIQMQQQEIDELKSELAEIKALLLNK